MLTAKGYAALIGGIVMVALVIALGISLKVIAAKDDALRDAAAALRTASAQIKARDKRLAAYSGTATGQAEGAAVVCSAGVDAAYRRGILVGRSICAVSRP